MTTPQAEHDALFFDVDGKFRAGVNRLAYWAASENADMTCAETDMEPGSDRYYRAVISGYESLMESENGEYAEMGG